MGREYLFCLILIWGKIVIAQFWKFRYTRTSPSVHQSVQACVNTVICWPKNKDQQSLCQSSKNLNFQCTSAQCETIMEEASVNAFYTTMYYAFTFHIYLNQAQNLWYHLLVSRVAWFHHNLIGFYIIYSSVLRAKIQEWNTRQTERPFTTLFQKKTGLLFMPLLLLGDIQLNWPVVPGIPQNLSDGDEWSWTLHWFKVDFKV